MSDNNFIRELLFEIYVILRNRKRQQKCLKIIIAFYAKIRGPRDVWLSWISTFDN